MSFSDLKSKKGLCTSNEALPLVVLLLIQPSLCESHLGEWPCVTALNALFLCPLLKYVVRQ